MYHAAIDCAERAVTMGHSKTAHLGRNRMEALYSDVMRQLEQLQLQNLRKSAKQYFQSAEVKKGWMRFNRTKSTETMLLSTPCKDAKVKEWWKQPHVPPNSPKLHRQSLPHHSVNSECRAFPKHYWNQQSTERRSETNIIHRQKQEKRASDANSGASSNRKVKHLGHELRNSRRPKSPPRVSQSSSEIGRFRKSIETKSSSSSKARTAVGCETLATTGRSSKGKPPSQPFTPIETDCRSTFFHVRNLQYGYEDTSPPIKKPETRPASITLRRQFNCNSLMERVKSQRALDAKLGHRKRECSSEQDMDAPVAIMTLECNKNRSRNKSESTTGALRIEDTIQKSRNFSKFSEAPTSYYLSGKQVHTHTDVDCNGATRATTDQIGSQQRPNSRATLDSSLSQKRCPLTTATRTTAILQDALEVLECAHRWNKWGARTLQELARASKAAAAERNRSLLGWSCTQERKYSIQKAKILLPHDNDVIMSTTRRGRVLESREEEREFIRDLLIASGITHEDWVDKHHLLNARQHIVSPTQTTPYRQTANVESYLFEKRSVAAERRNKKKFIEKRILYDFVEELLRHELEFRQYAQLGLNLEHKGQALVQSVWNHLQICSSPASDDIYTTVQNILQRDQQSQGSICVETVEVMEELDKTIYQDLMQELLEELSTVKSKAGLQGDNNLLMTNYL